MTPPHPLCRPSSLPPAPFLPLPVGRYGDDYSFGKGKGGKDWGKGGFNPGKGKVSQGLDVSRREVGRDFMPVPRMGALG